MKFFPFYLITILAACLRLMAQPAVSYKWTKTEIQADTLLNRQQVYDAMKLYNKVIRMQKKEKFKGQSGVRFKRALCYYYLTEFNKAISDLNIFIEQNPENLRAKLMRAYVYRELDRGEEQLSDINAVLQADPYNTDLLKWRAGLLLEMNRAEEALNALQNLQQFYNDEEVELNLGLAYYYLEQPDEALEHFNRAIFINGGYFPAYRYAALLCMEQEAYPRALEYIELALRLVPDDLNLILSKGISLLETGNPDTGCSFINKAFYAGMEEAAYYLEHYCYSVDD
ncbi:MAG: tetratricopeptide repeat protein [Cyclobacteriaceae bacterium]|nr:tetratricopeptide repeat protein [Cyclobacteriaceae bacterium]